jgi:hypothetical protein
MKNWKDFDWTDENGVALQPKYDCAAADDVGDAYAFTGDVEISSNSNIWFNETIFCGEFKVENWKESKIYRKDYRKETDKSEFNEENFLEFIVITGYDSQTLASIIEEFKSFLSLRKPLPKKLTDAMAILEKHSYKFTKG